MSGNAFEVTTADLDALAKHIGDISDQIQGEARTVRGAAEQVQSTWAGDAAAAFQNLMNRMDEDVRKLNEALREIQAAIASTADVYQRNEEEQKQAVQGIAGRL
ncbi:WXG100 family type VII secretion target [Lentzea atacamensis]|uniref:ESAT-6-like protein n=1 Tax=Lentzea atacamensis TaxID=531938 RepID=A0ABX9EDN8_9PSEU|nr:WXG100 family type VII secretion target [Lentzea atacamensis]RAS68762.1 WXG100 family type VII secretion target [Lentzea atacamensis]